MSYWKNYYKNKKKNLDCSLFAKYINQFYCKTPTKILELGCGDGRDAYFFAKNNNNNVLACDVSIKNTDTENCKFIQEDMGNLNLNCCYDIVYMRFSLHSVTPDIQDKIIKNIRNFGKILAIECRSINDSLCGQGKQVDRNAFITKTSYAEEHYRRFIDRKELEEQLKSQNYEILESSESTEYAPWGNNKNENPCCLRLIAKVLK